MAATTHSSDNTSSPWSLLNLLIGGALALFAIYWGGGILIGSVFQSIESRSPVETEEVAPADVVAANTVEKSAEAPAAPAPAPEAPQAAAPAAPAAAPAQAADVLEITIKPGGASGLEYDTKTMTVKAGQKVKLTFENQHAVPQPHNWVLCKPGTKDKVLMAAMALAADPQGMAKGFIPESEDILQHTNLIQPTQSETIEFAAPADPGEYPYLCTFPGHGVLMNGIMTVQ
ncbi:MAG: hypothetical protein KDK99_01615 [Verrucomicrobiales bacterium]|nr:hypothetical protein [Verrucomicrobiales bacterium]